MRTVAPVSPGEMLEDEFLKPLGLTKYRLAKDIGVPAQHIGDTDLRLCRYFGLSDGWSLRGQVNDDTAIAHGRRAKLPLVAAVAPEFGHDPRA